MHGDIPHVPFPFTEEHPMSEQNTPRNDEPKDATPLSDDELESVAGGTNIIDSCTGDCGGGDPDKPWWEITLPTINK